MDDKQLAVSQRKAGHMNSTATKAATCFCRAWHALRSRLAASTPTHRHAFGDQYRATDFVVPGAGKLEMTFTPADGGEPQKFEIFSFKGAALLPVCCGC